jgi:small-conductance mechanosensitive channel
VAFLDQLPDFLDPSRTPGALLYAAVALTLALVANRVVRAITTAAVRRAPETGRDPTALVFLGQLGQIFIWIGVLVFYAHLIPGLRAIGTALLAGVSIASIVIGLAAQNTLGNLVAGLSLLLYRPFRVGDRVQVSAPTGLETGTVERLTLGYTQLRTLDNRRIVLPNSVAANQVTVNLTASDPRALAAVPFAIAYTADLDRARAILLELARAHPKAHEVVGCVVDRLGESSVTLTVRAWCADIVAAGQLQADLLEQAKKRFATDGIEIPYPYRNVIIRRETQKGAP